MTGFTQGGWVVGNDTILPFPACVFNTSWNAFACPAFGEGYVQLRFTNMEYDSFDTMGRDGIDHTVLRNPNIRQTQQITWDLLRNIPTLVTGSIGKFAYTYLNQDNVLGRGFYSIRMPFDIPTPKNFKLSINKVVNGDWVVVALPFHKDTSFSITYGASQTSSQTPMINGTLSQVLMFPETYYYFDTSAEQLYVKLGSNDARDQFATIYNSFTSYSSSGIVSVVATCPTSGCGPVVLSNPTNAKQLYKTFMKEDRFVGILETCQQNATLPKAYTSGTGRVFAYLDPNSKTLDMTVYHNLNNIVTDISVGVGAYGKEVRKILSSYSNPQFSISRFMVDFSYDEWLSLLKGEVFVKVSTSQFPNGHLRGQLFCSSNSSCSVPPAIPPAQANSTTGLTVLTNVFAGITTSTITNNGDATNSITSDPFMDGNALAVNVQTGSVTFSFPEVSVAASTNGKLSYFEFFARNLDNDLPLLLALTFASSTKVYPTEVINRSNVLHYKIDTTKATRVRIPVSDIASGSNPKFKTITIELTDKSVSRSFVLDTLRFVQGDDIAISQLTTNQVVTFDKGSRTSCGIKTDPDNDPFMIRTL